MPDSSPGVKTEYVSGYIVCVTNDPILRWHLVFLNLFLFLLIELRSLSSTLKLALAKAVQGCRKSAPDRLKNELYHHYLTRAKTCLVNTALMQCNAHLQPTAPSPNKTPAAWLVNWLTEWSWNPSLFCLFLTEQTLFPCLLLTFNFRFYSAAFFSLS